MASMILVILLACGAGLLILVRDRRVEAPALIGLSLASAGLMFQHLARNGNAAQILAASAATGGLTATLILSLGYPGRDESGAGSGRVPAPRFGGLVLGMLLSAIVVGVSLLGPGPLLKATLLLLAGGTVVCWTAGSARRVAAGLVTLILGLHLLYLAMVARVSILEMLVLDSLPIVVAVVVASFHTALDNLRPGGQSRAAADTDAQEPLL